MAADLFDLKRVRITKETRAWLQARVHASGGERTAPEIAREALHEIAMREIHAAKVLVALSGSEGRVGDVEALLRDSEGRKR